MWQVLKGQTLQCGQWKLAEPLLMCDMSSCLHDLAVCSGPAVAQPAPTLYFSATLASPHSQEV